MVFTLLTFIFLYACQCPLLRPYKKLLRPQNEFSGSTKIIQYMYVYNKLRNEHYLESLTGKSPKSSKATIKK